MGESLVLLQEAKQLLTGKEATQTSGATTLDRGQSPAQILNR